MIRYIIPARKGSKGFKDKNSILFQYTLENIPYDEFSNVWVTTNDENVKKQAVYVNIYNRSDNLSEDNTSMKDVLIDVSKEFNDNDIIVMLYLTYPERTWNDIQKALSFYRLNKAKSLLCRMEVKSNPYLCMFEKGVKGEQVIKHNLYRRQDYKKCFEISHFIFIAQVDELKKLNMNLYNKNTVFMPIDSKIDVDTKEDYNKFLEGYRYD